MVGTYAAAWAAILALAGPGVDERDGDRLESIARDVAAAVDEADERRLPVRGPDGRARSAALLVAVGWHESGLAADVDRCERFGDGGRSVGVWQLHRAGGWAGMGRADLCADRGAQARAALEAVWRGGACPGGLGGALTAYNEGRCREAGPYARSVLAAYGRAWAAVYAAALK